MLSKNFFNSINESTSSKFIFIYSITIILFFFGCSFLIFCGCLIWCFDVLSKNQFFIWNIVNLIILLIGYILADIEFKVNLYNDSYGESYITTKVKFILFLIPLSYSIWYTVCLLFLILKYIKYITYYPFFIFPRNVIKKFNSLPTTEKDLIISQGKAKKEKGGLSYVD